MTHQPSPALLEPAEERDLVEDLTRAALGDSLPEELGVFEGHRDAYLDARGTVPAPRQAADEATGFGLDVVVLLTPYLVAGALAAIRFVAGLVGEAIKEETKPQVASFVRRIFRLDRAEDHATEAGDPLLAALPNDTVARVREVVLAVCRQHGLSEDDAGLVSDAVAGRLAVPH